MAGDGAGGDDECFGDQGVGVSGGDEAQNFDFAVTEAVGCEVRPAGEARSSALSLAGLVEVELSPVGFEARDGGIEMVEGLGGLAAGDGDFGEALVVAAGFDGAAFAFGPFEAGAVVLVSFFEEIEAECEGTANMVDSDRPRHGEPLFAVSIEKLKCGPKLVVGSEGWEATSSSWANGALSANGKAGHGSPPNGRAALGRPARPRDEEHTSERSMHLLKLPRGSPSRLIRGTSASAASASPTRSAARIRYSRM